MFIYQCKCGNIITHPEVECGCKNREEWILAARSMRKINILQLSIKAYCNHNHPLFPFWYLREINTNENKRYTVKN